MFALASGREDVCLRDGFDAPNVFCDGWNGIWLTLVVPLPMASAVGLSRLSVESLSRRLYRFYPPPNITAVPRLALYDFWNSAAETEVVSWEKTAL